MLCSGTDTHFHSPTDTYGLVVALALKFAALVLRVAGGVLARVSGLFGAHCGQVWRVRTRCCHAGHAQRGSRGCP